VSWYQKGKTNLDFTEARDSEWQWHQLGPMQVCTSLQTDNHASTPPLNFLQAGCPSCRPTNSVISNLSTSSVNKRQYQRGKTDLDFTEARDSEWQWHQLGHMQACTSHQTDNHASTPTTHFFITNQQRQSTEGT